MLYASLRLNIFLCITYFLSILCNFLFVYFVYLYFGCYFCVSGFDAELRHVQVYLNIYCQGRFFIGRQYHNQYFIKTNN